MRWPRNKRQGHGSRVSATQLAQMGVCEKLVVFEHRHGKRPSEAQKVAIERGLRAHKRFHRQASTSGDGFVELVLGQVARVVGAAGHCLVRWWLALWQRVLGPGHDH